MTWLLVWRMRESQGLCFTPWGWCHRIGCLRVWWTCRTLSWAAFVFIITMTMVLEWQMQCMRSKPNPLHPLHDNCLGERAGNASLAEIAVVLKDQLGAELSIDETHLSPVSEMVENFSGKRLARNSPLSERMCLPRPVESMRTGIVRRVVPQPNLSRTIWSKPELCPRKNEW